ncbi:RNA polymerase sigma factor [Polyangium mundeleinium]|uniref:Sigma-70 family RNA polymerase sigma factor n=1 Tax=Polyangium mundeleinium TaxID=2995306 RepID=A0ABT5EHK8_9BACT|nr:sigma-70 family RNA polymerase sigma factor [Polyangium mundeleinium]MDC0741246.1 sigma-70 family RNA polymerase sigma factor [Polyangium mundeleinium]
MTPRSQSTDFPAAIAALVPDIRQLVMGALRRQGADPDLAEELIQEIVITLLGSASTYRPELGALRPWAHGVAMNVVKNRRRSRVGFKGGERSTSTRAAGPFQAPPYGRFSSPARARCRLPWRALAFTFLRSTWRRRRRRRTQRPSPFRRSPLPPNAARRRLLRLAARPGLGSFFTSRALRPETKGVRPGNGRPCSMRRAACTMRG